nr:venom polypeptide precursor [Doratifera vulnerans]
MTGCALIFVFVAVLQVIAAQGPPQFPPNLPPQCRGPPPGAGKPHECCKVPAFFTDDDFSGCGFQKINPEGPPGPHHGPPDCSKQLCLLKKYNLLKDETTVDHDAVKGFLDKWAEANPHFQPVIATAKDRCVGKTLPGPPEICEANKLVFCVSSTLFEECPAWEETTDCKALKSHLDECKPYFRH